MKKLTYLLILLLMASMVFGGCSKKEEAPAEASQQTEADADPELDEEGIPEDAEEIPYNGISFEEEGEGYEIQKVEKDPSAFYGKWKGTSDMAIYLYGNVDLEIKEGGTWTGDITGEKLKGTWEAKGDTLYMNNDLFSFKLAFDKSGSLIMIEDDPEGDIHIVLTKQ